MLLFLQEKQLKMLSQQEISKLIQQEDKFIAKMKELDWQAWNLAFMNYSISFWFHRAEILLGTPFVLIVISYLVDKGYIRDYPNIFASCFFVYVTHEPLLRFIRRFSLKYIEESSDCQMIISYLASVVIVLLVAYFTYWILSKYFPIVMRVLSGGRG